MIRCLHQLLFFISTAMMLEKAATHDTDALKTRVKEMFYYAYDSYLEHAFPLDELRPLTCDGHDTWGSFSLTLIDSLDTLVVMGNYTEFQRAVDILLPHLNPDKNVNVSVFETNIRVVGGLISAHLLSKRAGIAVEPGWPCQGKLLRLAEKFASKLLHAFDTPSGMPYGTVNLGVGRVPFNETPITCVATIGTVLLEFGALSRLTGDQRYEEVALRAIRSLWTHRSKLGLVGNHINVLTGAWIAPEASIGAGIDSYFEYLLKASIMFRMPELDAMFREYLHAIKTRLTFSNWHFIVNMDRASVIMPVYQSLESFWPGTLAMAGDTKKAMEHLIQYHKVWKKFGFTPEFYEVTSGNPLPDRAAYPLRPEFIESIYYLYRATRDPYLLQMGVDVLTSIEARARTNCGFATIADVRTHTLENRMESFFLAETTKYLYLLFDTDNFIHQLPIHSWPSPNQKEFLDVAKSENCEVESGGYIFNTEAHPLDAGAIHCCSRQRVRELHQVAQLKNQIPLARLLNVNVSTFSLDHSKTTSAERTFPDASRQLSKNDWAFDKLLDRILASTYLEKSQEKLLHIIDTSFEGLAISPSRSLRPPVKHIMDSSIRAVGGNAWTTKLWFNLRSIVSSTANLAYPKGYSPPHYSNNNPLMSCAVQPFSVKLSNLQSLAATKGL